MNIEQRLKKLKRFEILVRSKQRERNVLGSMISQFSDEMTEKAKNRCRAIDDEISWLYDEREQLVHDIEHLDDPVESIVLRLYYVDDKPWNVIAYDMNYSIRTLQNIKRSAIRNLSKKINQVE
ncbi:sigma-70 family RNA polymerase sigma factor [Streptococcus suis]|uniref:RNA polymerase ECF family sigma factor n=1 Tax=Streptococcus suis TaxID=1307 RepID=A0A123UD13_STRSU|nr:hypothetical protein [Streptococcus suis]NQG45863.1 sigma-70 family RNA polymerase sigma factor [Streptococcus suis]NQG70274.1 sigma-70 family RNA polymerase sigma factor [Streptococcus suis]NQH63360.1 sigma-70 family RNA polymerase sigma factor [Streptococcus suis]CYU52240.1 RNA polymerase ECF family sigma factor [Streptococcus suis]CYW00072.1 RNA polymerase ECF family sigma factor [Streptococcus suis]